MRRPDRAKPLKVAISALKHSFGQQPRKRNLRDVVVAYCGWVVVVARQAPTRAATVAEGSLDRRQRSCQLARSLCLKDRRQFPNQDTKTRNSGAQVGKEMIYILQRPRIARFRFAPDESCRRRSSRRRLPERTQRASMAAGWSRHRFLLVGRVVGIPLGIAAVERLGVRGVEWPVVLEAFH